MARAGITVEVDGFFPETYFDPAKAKSYEANMLPLHLLNRLFRKLTRLREVVINM